MKGRRRKIGLLAIGFMTLCSSIAFASVTLLWPTVKLESLMNETFLPKDITQNLIEPAGNIESDYFLSYLAWKKIQTSA